MISEETIRGLGIRLRLHILLVVRLNENQSSEELKTLKIRKSNRSFFSLHLPNKNKFLLREFIID